MLFIFNVRHYIVRPMLYKSSNRHSRHASLVLLNISPTAFFCWRWMEPGGSNIVIRMPPTSRLSTRLSRRRHLSSTCNILKFAINNTIYRVLYALFICHTNISCINTYSHEIKCPQLAYCTILSTYSPFKTTSSKRLLAQWAKTVVVIFRRWLGFAARRCFETIGRSIRTFRRALV